MKSEHCSLCLSKDGLKLNGKKLSLLEWIFDFDLSGRKFSGEWNDKSERNFNCAVCFDFAKQMGAFSKHIDIWFSEDGRSMSSDDYAKIDAFYDANRISFNKKIKLDLDLIYDKSVSQIEGIKTEADFVVYNCILCRTKNVGLSRFHLYYTCPDLKALDRYYEKTKFEELKLAILDKKTDEVRKLIDEGADVNALHPSMLTSPLDMAVAVDSYEICEMLIKAGADVNFKNGFGPGLSMMKMAERNKNHQIGSLLVRSGLIEYLEDYMGKKEYTKRLFTFFLECGVNPNRKRNVFPLMKSVWNENVEQTEMLLKFGANPNIVDECGRIPLRKAIFLDNSELAALLIQYGADVNFVADGKTNLKAALIRNDISRQTVKVLILGGARINARYDLNLRYKPDWYITMVNKYVNGIMLKCFLKDELDVFVDLMKFEAV